MDWQTYPYPSRRRVLFGPRGAVATSQPLAVSAGMKMLQEGGSAVDAAVAMAAALAVVEPTSNGLGSDAFAIVASGGRLYGLNSSGPSPRALPAEELIRRGRMPRRGWAAVTVPGAVAAWQALHERWGRLEWPRLLEPAIGYAEEGFPVSPLTAHAWEEWEQVARSLDGAQHQEFLRVFFPGGRAPRAGERWRSPELAASLRAIAGEGADWFYRGDFAERLEEYAAASGGYLRGEDLAAFRPEWVEPLAVPFGGLEVYELPPNGQGLAALLALQILKHLPLTEHPRESVTAYHYQIEAMKLAFADVRTHVADPRHMKLAASDFLNDDYAARRAGLVGEKALVMPTSGLPRGGTVYLAAAAGDLAVSFIQSNYMGFGAGVAVPGTGVSLQNRGAGFVTEPGHANVVAAGKRPYHTIIPGFLGRKGEPWGPFGLMGGPMQPQGHVQLVVNMAVYGLNPQSALDAPRWQVTEDGEVWLEPSVPEQIVSGLAERGHRVRVVAEELPFGKGQILLRQPAGWAAASEPRADGQAQVF